MDVMNSAQNAFDKGFSALKGAVSGVAIENQPYMRGFARLCNDGWLQGWHERNGGNLSYRLTSDEVASSRSFFDENPCAWTPLGIQITNLGGAHFAVTGAGRYMRNVQADPSRNVAIVQLNSEGDAWRKVWGLVDGGSPTSELASHIMNHSVRMEATQGSCRVMYHAHPDYVIALTKVMPLDARVITRALWKSMTECVMVLPQGIGVVECMVPGSLELARASSELMKSYDAVIWALHGLFASGPDFDATFGLMHAVEKAAFIHAQALMMNSGSDDFANTISDEMLRAIATSLGLNINEEFLD